MLLLPKNKSKQFQNCNAVKTKEERPSTGKGDHSHHVQIFRNYINKLILDVIFGRLLLIFMFLEYSGLITPSFKTLEPK